MMKNCKLTLGYDFDKWYDRGEKEAIQVDVSASTNSHILICGMSGSGKSFCENILLAKLKLLFPESEMYMADYKQEDILQYLRPCSHYFPYKRSLEVLDIVYEKLHQRQLGLDNSRRPVLLLWDEYVANMLALLNEDKKKATTAMNKVAEILMLGRSLSVRFVTSCQRPDAIVFPTGSRLNYGVIIILGAAIRSIYEMLIPTEYIDLIGSRQFETGEGVVLLQGSTLRFIKIPFVKSSEHMRELCIKALS